MIHVLNEKDLIVESFLVFRIGTRSLSSWVFSCDDFQRLKHGFVDACICLVNCFSNFKVVGCGEHGLQRQGERREDADETNNTFTLLDFDLCIFDGADLFVQKFVEEADEACMKLLKCPGEEFLARLFKIDKLSLDCCNDANPLPMILLDD